MIWTLSKCGPLPEMPLLTPPTPCIVLFTTDSGLMKSSPQLQVREIEPDDIDHIVRYWLGSDHHFLRSMGVDLGKLPEKEDLIKMIGAQLEQPYDQKHSFAMIWMVNGESVGHCNVNDIKFGTEAYMHLHMWRSDLRHKGVGSELLRLTLPHFFEKLDLDRLISEPYALNEAPNRTLPKVGFILEKEYTTVPGSLSFEQPVKRWVLHRPS